MGGHGSQVRAKLLGGSTQVSAKASVDTAWLPGCLAAELPGCLSSASNADQGRLAAWLPGCSGLQHQRPAFAVPHS